MNKHTIGKVITELRAALLIIAVIAVTVLAVNATPVWASGPQYTNWQEYPSNPVFDPAERAYYPSILFDGSNYRMWYDDGSGTRYTASVDGISWAAGMVVTGLTNARHAHVERVGSKYMVWYWDSSQLYSINDMRSAESTDGVNWTSDSAITQVGTTVIAGNPGVNWNAGSYGPCDVFYNPAGSPTIVSPVSASTVWQNKFVLYYDGTTGAVEDTGLAVSADGKLWQGYNNGAAPVLSRGASGAWDEGFATFSTVLKVDGAYHMWYSGGQAASSEGIGYAQSSDGVNWTKYTGNPMLHKNDGVTWRASRTYTPMVVYDSSGFSGYGEFAYLKMWYAGVNAGGNYTLGYAKIPLAAPTPTPTPPVSVGGTIYPVNKTQVLLTWLLPLLMLSLTVGGITLRLHKITQS